MRVLYLYATSRLPLYQKVRSRKASDFPLYGLNHLGALGVHADFFDEDRVLGGCLKQIQRLARSVTKRTTLGWSIGIAIQTLKRMRDYDLVFAGNLLDRLYSPRKFLAEIAARIRPGGLLVLTSPYTWLEEHTERAEWIGGFKRDGEKLTTLDGLSETLAAGFVPLGDPCDVPFVIRETRRKFQHSIAQLTVWEKRT